MMAGSQPRDTYSIRRWCLNREKRSLANEVKRGSLLSCHKSSLETMYLLVHVARSLVRNLPQAQGVVLEATVARIVRPVID